MKGTEPVNLYLHVDRSGRLPLGKMIETQLRPGEDGLAGYAAMFAPGFTEHIKTLCIEGISAHGIQYLIRFFENETHTPLLFKELFLEFVRWKYAIAEPSRFQSFFAWGSYTDALSFSKLVSRDNPQRRIIEVEPLSQVFKGDMNLTRGFAKEDLFLAYWNGERLDNTAGYAPVWEYVLKPPIRVIREITQGASVE